MSKKDEKAKPKYEAPEVIPLGESARGANCTSGTEVTGVCSFGFNGGGACTGGSAPTGTCNPGMGPT